MFVFLIVGLLVGAAIQLGVQGAWSRRRVGEVGLLWVLVGYCGVSMLLHSAESLLLPALVADWHGFPAGGIWQAFTTVALLGMAVSAVLAIWYRGAYLIGPSLTWAVYFGGATVIHLQDEAAKGPLTTGAVAGIFVTHGLIALLLLVFLAMSGALARRERPS